MSAVIQLAEYRQQHQEQPEKRMQDGFVAVPNSMMDALLSADLTGRQLKMALAIIRKTIGFGKAEDDCTITQLAEVAGIDRSDASRAIQSLIDSNVVSARKGRHGQVVSVNPPESWGTVTTTNVAKHHGQNATNVAKHHDEACQNATHNRQLQQTTTITPCIPQVAEPAEPAEPAKPKKSANAKTFRKWSEEVKAAGEELISTADPIFAYAEDAGIPIDFLRLAWVEFRDRYTHEQKRYTDWRNVFRKSVRERWLNLWYLDAGEYKLTSTGQQAMAVMQKREVQSC